MTAFRRWWRGVTWRSRYRRCVERIGPVATGIMLARVGGLNARGRWLEGWCNRNWKRLQAVAGKASDAR